MHIKMHMLVCLLESVSVRISKKEPKVALLM